MRIKEIQVKNLINTITKKDMLFHGQYTIDPYQNCSFGCIYCDSTVDDTIYVKINVVDILNTELQKLCPGRIIIGSVHDPYQPVEQSFHLTHHILSRLSQTPFSVHILTKSPTILNDIFLIKELNDPIITFTILGLEESFWKNIEPGAPSPLKRLQAMKIVAEHNIKTGIAIIPIFPFISKPLLKNLIRTAKQFNASYILHKPLFLQGLQKQKFLNQFNKHYPEFYKKYKMIYKNSPIAPSIYTKKLKDTILKTCHDQHIPTEIPKN